VVVAAALSARRLDPLRCTDTELPPELLLIGKLLALALLWGLGPLWSPELFLPFLEPLDALRGAWPWLRRVFGALLPLGACGLLLNVAPRASALSLGGVVLSSILLSRVVYSNTYLLYGLVLVLIGLHEGRQIPSRVLRLQLVIIYLGAGLNKLLEPDWRSGRYFEFWTSEILHHGPYRWAAAQLPPGTLSSIACWLVIAAELALAGLLLTRRTQRLGMALGVGFHVGMLAFTAGRLSWLFMYPMLACYLALARWPRDDTPRWQVAAVFALAALVLAFSA
jgi:hypothetical protein